MFLAIVGSSFRAGIYRIFDLETLILKKQPKDMKLPGHCWRPQKTSTKLNQD